MSADYYAALGVSRDAGEDAIKKAYRTQARKLHPDVNRHDPAAEEKFKVLAEAYEVLSDPEKRAMYDRYGTVRPEDLGGFQTFGDFGFDAVSDIFGMFFGEGAGRRRVDLSGRDVGVELAIDFEDAVFGTRKDVTVDKQVLCEACEGSGAGPGTGTQTCADCDGRGVTRAMQRTFLGTVTRETVCTRCGGLGEVLSSPCGQCSGHGRHNGRDTLSVDVPGGVEDGTTLRITGAGEAGVRGGRAGDLFVQLRVAPHEVFERHGDNLYALVPLSFSQAALGTEVTVPTLDGEQSLKVHAGTQPGERFVLRGKGVVRLHGRGRGDLILETMVEVPKKLDRETRRIVEQLDRHQSPSGTARLVSPRERGVGA